MKKKNALLLLVLFTVTVALSSCATKKKYGCPERISLPSFIQLIK